MFAQVLKSQDKYPVKKKPVAPVPAMAPSKQVKKSEAVAKVGSVARALGQS